jgi:hypothetical protein
MIFKMHGMTRAHGITKGYPPACPVCWTCRSKIMGLYWGYLLVNLALIYKQLGLKNSELKNWVIELGFMRTRLT